MYLRVKSRLFLSSLKNTDNLCLCVASPFLPREEINHSIFLNYYNCKLLLITIFLLFFLLSLTMLISFVISLKLFSFEYVKFQLLSKYLLNESLRSHLHIHFLVVSL